MTEDKISEWNGDGKKRRKPRNYWVVYNRAWLARVINRKMHTKDNYVEKNNVAAL